MFNYQPLDQSRAWPIRILILLPAKHRSDPIRCSLAHEFLSDDTNYDALSYTWGSPEDMSPLPAFLEDCPLKIQSNLDAALRHLRLNDASRRLWIDALCINQADNVEKGQQIGMMDLIFESAATVEIWLGPKSEDSVLAMTTLAGIADDPDFADFDAEASTALGNLFSRSWFKRIWVLQEFKRAKNPRFQCGDAYFYWNAVEEPFRELWMPGESLDLTQSTLTLVQGIASMLNLSFLRAKFPTFKEASSSLTGRYTIEQFVRILRMYGGNHSTVPHDKIYGLLGLFTSTDWLAKGRDHPPEIDYNAPFAEVYLRWAKYLVLKGGSLDLLYITQRTLHPRETGLPSWVPDWRSARTDLPLTLDIFRTTFAYSGPYPGLLDPTPHFNNGDSALSIRGFIVVEISSSFEFVDVDSTKLRNMFESQTFTDVLMASIMMRCRLDKVQANDVASLGIAMGRTQINLAKGRAGLVTNEAQHGDFICVLGNAAVPFVLRKVSTDSYELIGDAYIDCAILNNAVEPTIQMFNIQ